MDCGVWNHGAIGHLCNAKSSSQVIFLRTKDSRFEQVNKPLVFFIVVVNSELCF
jgi:hypothetical protein